MQKNSKRNNLQPEDIELVESIRSEEDQQSLRLLTDRHAPLIASIAMRLAKRFNNWSVVTELLNEKEYIVYMSAKKYNPNKNTKFSTFLGNETKWSYLNKCNHQRKNNRHIFTEPEILDKVSKGTENSPILGIQERDTLEYIFRVLDKHPDSRLKKVFTMRYKIGKSNKVMPWHLVGTEVGLSAQGCINIHKTGINYIKNELNKEGILKC